MIQLSIAIGSKTAFDVRVTVVGEGMFRLEEEPLLFLAADRAEEIELYPRYGDTVFAERIDSTTARYLGICERGHYKHHDFVLSEALARSSCLAEFLSKVVQDGGHWEQHMGGVFAIALPPSSSLDPDEFIAQARRGA